MFIYDVFPTGHKLGFIEVVKESKTVYEILTEGGLREQFQMSNSQLYKWISEKNPKEKYKLQLDYFNIKNFNKIFFYRLNKAIDNFTRSCAGFCVATFILGIGDRHPSNIMVNEEGKVRWLFNKNFYLLKLIFLFKLFHIDFGHFLGHYKEKYGFKRERVPFVLTEHFTKVISKGAIDSLQTFEFQKYF